MKRSQPTTEPRGRQWEGEAPAIERRACRMADTRDRLSVAVPKENPVRDEAYRRLVAEQDCAHCGRPGPSQCAHSDQGKGLGIKASDLETYPLCADQPGRQGCHSVIGASGLFTREQRRTLESRYVALTKALLGKE
jgi:hypothetical protein